MHFFCIETPRCRRLSFATLQDQVRINSSSNIRNKANAFRGSGKVWRASTSDVHPVFTVNLYKNLYIVHVEFSVRHASVDLTLVTVHRAKAKAKVMTQTSCVCLYICMSVWVEVFTFPLYVCIYTLINNRRNKIVRFSQIVLQFCVFISCLLLILPGKSGTSHLKKVTNSGRLSSIS